jgi:glycosyltransferase involved in cell wall biosynthesis
MPDHAVDISVVLPIYNQADHVERIVTGFVAALSHLKHTAEVLLVVNGNRDGSLDRCRDLAATFPEVKVIHLEKSGWGRAVRAGFEAARGRILSYTNAARTSPEVLALHVMLAIANPQCAIKANRRLRFPFHRRVGSVLYNLECRYLYGLPVWDVNGTPKALSRDTYELFHLEENGDLIDVEFILNCKTKGVQIIEVPIVSTERHGGESTTNFSSAFKMYWGAVKLFSKFRDRLRDPRGLSS